MTLAREVHGTPDPDEEQFYTVLPGEDKWEAAAEPGPVGRPAYLRPKKPGLAADGFRVRDQFEIPASPRVIDFGNVPYVRQWKDVSGRWHTDVLDDRPEATAAQAAQMGITERSLMTRKQLRRKAKRLAAAGKPIPERLMRALYKPIEEWDAEELARGRPRNAQGSFQGAPPSLISREVHERAMEKFQEMLKSDMNAGALTAMGVVNWVMKDSEEDHRGRPRTASSTKLDAAKFLIEHAVGKPKVQVQQDISVKLQGILAEVMVNPDESSPMGYSPAHIGTRGAITASSDNIEDADWEDED